MSDNDGFVTNIVVTSLMDKIDGLCAENESLRNNNDNLSLELKDLRTKYEHLWYELHAVLTLYEAVKADADRYIWLTDDHESDETRQAIQRICKALPIRGKGATDAAIDSLRK